MRLRLKDLTSLVQEWQVSTVRSRAETNKTNIAFFPAYFIIVYTAFSHLLFPLGSHKTLWAGQGRAYPHFTEEEFAIQREINNDLPKGSCGSFQSWDFISVLVESAGWVWPKWGPFTEGDRHTERKGTAWAHVLRLCTGPALGGCPFLTSPSQRWEGVFGTPRCRANPFSWNKLRTQRWAAWLFSTN